MIVLIFLFLKILVSFVFFVLIILLCSGNMVWKCRFCFCFVELLVELFFIRYSLFFCGLCDCVGVNFLFNVFFDFFFFLLLCVFFFVLWVVLWVCVVLIVFFIRSVVILGFFFKKYVKCLDIMVLIEECVLFVFSFFFVCFLNWSIFFGICIEMIVVIFLWIFVFFKFLFFFFNSVILWVYLLNICVIVVLNLVLCVLLFFVCILFINDKMFFE